MSQSPGEVIDELRERMENLDQQINETIELYEEVYGKPFDPDESEETASVEIPAAGRTNWEHGISESVEVNADQSSGETYTEEVPIQGGDVDNPDTIEVERSADDTLERLNEWRAKLHEMRVESQKERTERANRHRERLNSTPFDDEAESSDIPAAGRSNWERRQKEGDQ